MNENLQPAEELAQIKNTGIPYELLVQQLILGFSQLHGSEIDDVRVDHNVDLDGCTLYSDGSLSKHQVDVSWHFKLAGEPYHVVIQAKELVRKIEFAHVLTFCSVIRDLPNNPVGLMVTTKGFQYSAFEFGKAHGILLCRLRDPTKADFPMVPDVPQFQANLHPLISSFDKVCIACAYDAGDKNRVVPYLNRPPHLIQLFDLSGSYRGTLQESIRKAIERQLEILKTEEPQTKKLSISYGFAEPISLPLNLARHPAFLTKVSFDVEVQILSSVKLKNAVAHIFELVTGGNRFYLDEQGTVRRVDEPLSDQYTFQTNSGPVIIKVQLQNEKHSQSFKENTHLKQ